MFKFRKRTFVLLTVLLLSSLSISAAFASPLGQEGEPQEEVEQEKQEVQEEKEEVQEEKQEVQEEVQEEVEPGAAPAGEPEGGAVATETNPVNLGTLVCLGAGILVLLMGAVVIVVLLSRSRKAANETGTEPD